MANTSYVLIEKITVGAAGANTVKFSNIPQTGYTDLVIKHSTRMTEAANSNDISVNFNGVGWNTSVASKRVYGSGSGTGSDSNAMFGGSNGASSTASTFNNSEIYIANYTSSAYKSYSVDQVSENNATAAYAMLGAQLWQNTSAITSIELRVSGGSYNFVQYSTFYLYGVAKLGTTPAIVPYATGGDTIMTDGTYWYHAFLASGTFTPAKALSCDVLVVAGGGGGSGAGGYSGAGAGGIFYATAQSYASGTGYTATIGGGGASATNGSNSTFASLTAAVGGGKGGATNAAGSNGGNGGGGGANTGAAGTSTQTSTGGTGYGNAGSAGAAGFAQGGGGGGAGGAGSNTPTVGVGGIGTTAFSSWGSITGTGKAVSTTYYFSTGGSNGNGSTTTGGGVQANSGNGGNWDQAGSSGVVIVRYAV
jgi:hypothetical protein